MRAYLTGLLLLLDAMMGCERVATWKSVTRQQGTIKVTFHPSFLLINFFIPELLFCRRTTYVTKWGWERSPISEKMRYANGVCMKNLILGCRS